MSTYNMDDEDLFGEDYFGDLDFDDTPGSSSPPGKAAYFKNVAKSAKNVAYNFSSHLMPGATETVKGIFEALSTIKDKISDKKEKVLKRMESKRQDGSVLENLKKSLGEKLEGAKTAIKTGNFAKANDEFDINAMFDDEEEEEDQGSFYDDIFGGDSYDSYDSGSSDNSSESLEFDPSQYSANDGEKLPPMKTLVKKKVVKNVIVKGADTKKIVAAQGATTAALIETVNALSRQHEELAEARHKEQILLLTNIQKNMYKTASFTGGNFKASLDFYRKMLKGTIDIHGIMKEKREMDIDIFKHEQDIWRSEKVNSANVFGSGFNGQEWVKGIGQNLKNMFDFSALGQLYEADAMMRDVNKMSGKKGGLGTMLLNPYTLISNLLVSGQNKIGFDKLDRTIKGLPAIINNILMKTANNDMGIKGKIAEALAIKDEDTSFDVSRYSVTDLKRPTAFDMETRQSIVEVIPTYLRGILAAVSGKEEMFYDHRSKSLRAASAVNREYEQNKRMALYSDTYFTDLTNKMRTSMAKLLEKNKGIVFENKEEYNAIFDRMIENMILQQEFYDPKNAKLNSSYRGRITTGMSADNELNEAMLDIFNALYMGADGGFTADEIGGFQRGLAIGKANKNVLDQNYGDYKGAQELMALGATQNIRRLQAIRAQKKFYENKRRNSDGTLNLTAENMFNKYANDESLLLTNQSGLINEAPSVEMSRDEKRMIEGTSRANVLTNIYKLLLEGVGTYNLGYMPEKTYIKRKRFLGYMNRTERSREAADKARNDAIKENMDREFASRKEQQFQIEEMRKNGVLGGSLTRAFLPAMKFDQGLGWVLNTVNNGLGDIFGIKDTTDYARKITKDDMTAKDKKLDELISGIEKHGEKNTFFGRMAKWVGSKARSMDDKRKEYNYSHWKDSEDSKNFVQKANDNIRSKIYKFMNRNKKESDLIEGVDYPVKMKKKFPVMNNGLFAIFCTTEDAPVVKDLLERFRFSYISPEDGVDIDEVDGIYCSAKFIQQGKYEDLLKEIQEKKAANSTFVKIIETPSELKDFLVNEAKIYLGDALNRVNKEEFDKNHDFYGQLDKEIAEEDGDYNVKTAGDNSHIKTAKAESRAVKLNRNRDSDKYKSSSDYHSNLTSIESILQKIYERMDEERNVKHMETAVSLLAQIADAGGAGGIDIKEIEKSFDRERKKGMKDQRDKSIVKKILKAPFKFAGWATKGIFKNLGFLAGLPFRFLGGLMGGIAGGLGAAIPGMAKLLTGALSGLGTVAGFGGKALLGLGGLVGKGLIGGGKLLGKGLLGGGKLLGKGLLGGGKLLGKGLLGGGKLLGKGLIGGGKKLFGAAKWAGGKVVGGGLKVASGIGNAAGWLYDHTFGRNKIVGYDEEGNPITRLDQRRAEKKGAKQARKDLKGRKKFKMGETLKETFANALDHIPSFGALFSGGAKGRYEEAMLTNLMNVRMILEKQFGPIDPKILSQAMTQFKKQPGLIRRVGSTILSAPKNILGAMRKKDKIENAKNPNEAPPSSVPQFQAHHLFKNPKRTPAGFADSGRGDGLREGSFADIRKDHAEKEALARQEEAHAALILTAANTSALLEKEDKDKDDKSNGGGSGGVLGGLLGGLGANFMTSIFGGSGKKGLLKSTAQRLRILGKKFIRSGVGKTMVKAGEFVGRGGIGLLKGVGKGVIGAGKFALKPAFAIGKKLLRTKAGKAAAGLVGKIGSWIQKVIGKLFKNKTIAKKLGPKAIKALLSKLPNTLTSGLKKAGPKVAAKIGAKIGISATGVGAIAVAAFEITMAVINFGTGFAKAGELFGLPAGENPTLSMRLTAGVVKALDGLLFGLPSLVLGLDTMVKFVYEAINGAIQDDKKWQEERAKLYGIMKNFGGFEEYHPTPTTPKQSLIQRGAGMMISAAIPVLGAAKVAGKLMKGARGLNKASLLGFKSSVLYKKWKEKRFEPCKEIERQIVDSLGGRKKVSTNMEIQEQYKEEMRKRLPEFVKNNKLDWLTSEADEKSDPEAKTSKKSISNAMAGTTGMAAAAAMAPRQGSSPGAEGGNEANAGDGKKGILSTASSFIMKNKKNLIAFGLFGPMGVLAMKGAQLVGSAIKWGADKIKNVINWAAEKSGLIGDKTMELINSVLSGNPVPQLFAFAFDVIKGFIKRALKRNQDQLYTDDAYMYGLSFNKNRQALKKFGINNPEDMVNLKMSDAVYIYYEEYYKKHKIDKYAKDPILAHHYFSHMMDTSPAIANSMMKQVEKLPEDQRASCFVQLRYNYYRNLAFKDSLKKAFLPMWISSIEELNASLGFNFKEGQSYGIDEIDEQTTELITEQQEVNGMSPDADSSSDPTAMTGDGYAEDNSYGNSMTVDDSAASESPPSISPSSYNNISSSSSSAAPIGANPSKDGSGDRKVNANTELISANGTKTFSDMFTKIQSLEDFIKEELRLLGNIEKSTGDSVLTMATINNTLIEGFNKLIAILNKGNTGEGISIGQLTSQGQF